MPARPGRPLRDIVDDCSSDHRAWLKPTREAYLRSTLTMSVLSSQLHMAKSKISELLSGRLYPRWDQLASLAAALSIPTVPLYRLWMQAAPAIRLKTPTTWNQERTPTTQLQPPVDHTAFRELTDDNYHFYAGVFLPDPQHRAAVRDTYDQLWLSWNQALASADIRRYAWDVLRTTVMRRTPHIDNRPQFGHTAFDTVAMTRLNRPDHAQSAVEQFTETQNLYRAMSRLPASQLDVMVLRSLGGLDEEAVSSLLGVPLASVRSDERYATQVLARLLRCPPPHSEGNRS
ncbi:sigma-70 family RNA polymerase sigma factor [Streptomyces sp. NPDC001904]|uniref:sigma-70 family RNA polymerase sigma factor n=1 Tax=Streptomyces sp. NPDC001904 TaxID=3154531 RepID=UPI003323B866